MTHDFNTEIFSIRHASGAYRVPDKHVHVHCHFMQRKGSTEPHGQNSALIYYSHVHLQDGFEKIIDCTFLERSTKPCIIRLNIMLQSLPVSSIRSLCNKILSAFHVSPF